MVEHFAAQVQNEIGGKAKAMIVTRSRLHAVRYKLAVDKYLAERGLPFKALVAFSGTVEDGGRSYTETGMNGFSEAQTAKTFRASGEPVPDRRQQIPDRLRSAAAAHDVRGQEARRRERGADALAPQPHPSREERNYGARFRQRGGRDQGCLRALLRDHAALRSDRSESALRDPNPARRVPGLHRDRRKWLRPGLFRSESDAGPALRRARARRRAIQSRSPRTSSTISAANSPTMCASTRSCRRC